MKSLLRSKPVQWAASLLIVGYIRLVAATTRWTMIGREDADRLNAGGQGFIVAFWHNRLLMGAVLRRLTTKRIFMLSSNHPDAEIIVNAARRLGVEFIRGSAANPKKQARNKGGTGALVQMIGAIRQGDIVGVTPDGPRGPREVVHPGVIKLSQLTGAPILPGAYSVTRGRFLNSWDRFLFPFPFGKGWYVGEPAIAAPAPDASSAELEEKRLALAAALTRTAARADALAGRSEAPQEPAAGSNGQTQNGMA